MAKWMVLVSERNYYAVQVEADDRTNAIKGGLNAVKTEKSKPYDTERRCSYARKIKD